MGAHTVFVLLCPTCPLGMTSCRLAHVAAGVGTAFLPKPGRHSAVRTERVSSSMRLAMGPGGGGGHPSAAVTNAARRQVHGCSLESLPAIPPGPCPERDCWAIAPCFLRERPSVARGQCPRVRSLHPLPHRAHAFLVPAILPDAKSLKTFLFLLKPKNICQVQNEELLFFWQPHLP